MTGTLDGFNYQIDGNNEFSYNVAAGSETIGVEQAAQSCHAPPRYHHNVIHSSVIGLYVGGVSHEGATTSDQGLSSRGSRYPIDPSVRGLCGGLYDYRIHRIWNMGVHVGAIHSASLRLIRFTFVDAGFAVTFASIGPDSSVHDRSRPDLHLAVEDSLFVGGNYRCRNHGVGGALFGKQTKQFCREVVRTHPTLYQGTVIKNTSFVDYGVSDADGTLEYPGALGIACQPGDRNVAIHNDQPNDGHSLSSSDSFVTIETMNISWINTPLESRVHFTPPVLEVGNNFACAQFDCDGARSALLIDRDGTVVEGGAGTLVAENEIRWDDPLQYVDERGIKTMAGLIPPTLLFDANNTRKNTTDVYTHAGIYREGCTHHPENHLYSCPGGKQRSLIFEDVTAVAMDRRIAPTAVIVDGHVALYTGPKSTDDTYMAEANIRRLNTFWTVIALDKVATVVYSSLPPPPRHRLHLRDCVPGEGAILRMFYNLPNRLDVYVGSRLVTANLSSSSQQLTTWRADTPHGASHYDRSSGWLYVSLNGPDPVDVITAPAIVLAVGVEMTQSSFTAQGRLGLVNNIAILLGIPQSRIAVVTANSDDSSSTTSAYSRRRLSNVDTTNTSLMIVIEEEPVALGGSAAAIDLTSQVEFEAKQVNAAKSLNANALPNLLVAVTSGSLASTITDTPGLAAPVVDAAAVKPIDLGVPGWTGNTSNFDADDGCHCAYGVWDPDCSRGGGGGGGGTRQPAVLTRLSDLDRVANCPSTGVRYVPPVAAAAMVATSTACEQLSDESTCISDPACDWSASSSSCDAKPTTPPGTVPGASVCVRTVLRQSSPLTTSGSSEVATGECGLMLEGWAGPGEMYGSDGQCQCGRGLWDPDCDAVDFTSSASSAESTGWGCPPFNATGQGERYICQRDERRCAVDGLLLTTTTGASTEGLAAGYCLAVRSTGGGNNASSAEDVVKPPACPSEGYLDPCVGDNRSYVAGGVCAPYYHTKPPPPPSPPPSPSPPPARWSLEAVVALTFAGGGSSSSSYTAETFDTPGQRAMFSAGVAATVGCSPAQVIITRVRDLPGASAAAGARREGGGGGDSTSSSSATRRLLQASPSPSSSGGGAGGGVEVTFKLETQTLSEAQNYAAAITAAVEDGTTLTNQLRLAGIQQITSVAVIKAPSLNAPPPPGSGASSPVGASLSPPPAPSWIARQKAKARDNLGLVLGAAGGAVALSVAVVCIWRARRRRRSTEDFYKENAPENHASSENA